MITGDANISINGGRLVNGLNNQISIGSAIYYNGTSTLSLLANTDIGLGLQSYGTDTGALVVSGGAGIQKDLWVGGTIHGSIDSNSLLGALSTISVLSSTATQSLSTLVNDSITTVTYYLALVDKKGGEISGVYADSLVYYKNTNTTLVAPIFSATSGTVSTSTTTGDIIVKGGVGIGGDVNIGGVLTVAGDPGDIRGVRHIYTADGNVKEDNLLYTPRVIVGDITVVQAVTPRVGDFWIDIGSNAEYQYIDDGGQRFWLQIAQI
jgi:hypothetical protein